MAATISAWRAKYCIARQSRSCRRWCDAVMFEPCDIVRLNRQHAAAAASIESWVFVDPWSEAMLAGELEHPAGRCYGAVSRADGRLLGYVCVMVVADECSVHRIATLAGQQRRGIATSLLRHALAAAQAEGCTQATLEVSTANIAALTCYRRLGFRVTGTRPGYYRQEGSDALIMQVTWNSQENDR